MVTYEGTPPHDGDDGEWAITCPTCDDRGVVLDAAGSPDYSCPACDKSALRKAIADVVAAELLAWNTLDREPGEEGLPEAVADGVLAILRGTTDARKEPTDA